MTTHLTVFPLERSGAANRDHAAAHRTVMCLFAENLGDSPRSNSSTLFRVESDFGRILVQSTLAPERDQVDVLGLQVRECETTDFPTGTRVRYRIDVAAVRRTGRQERRVPAAEVGQWWQDLARRNGLQLEGPAAEHLLGIDDRTSTGSQPHMRVARLSGTAIVADADALTHAMRHGVGRAKSYGCGLLSVIPL